METINKCLEYFGISEISYVFPTIDNEFKKSAINILQALAQISLLYMNEYKFTFPGINPDQEIKIINLHLRRYNAPFIIPDLFIDFFNKNIKLDIETQKFLYSYF